MWRRGNAGTGATPVPALPCPNVRRSVHALWEAQPDPDDESSPCSLHLGAAKTVAGSYGRAPRESSGRFARGEAACRAASRPADMGGMTRVVLNRDHLTAVLAEALARCQHRLFLATADVKDLHVPVASRPGGGGARSIVEVFEGLARRHVEVRLLHGGVPSGPFLGRLKAHVPATLIMRRCPRAHIKAVVVDGRWMYLGSANLTGAGLGAKSRRRRNFEGGVWTDQPALIDPVLDMLDAIWEGEECRDCGRRDYCPVPLEEPEL